MPSRRRSYGFASDVPSYDNGYGYTGSSSRSRTRDSSPDRYFTIEGLGTSRGLGLSRSDARAGYEYSERAGSHSNARRNRSDSSGIFSGLVSGLLGRSRSSRDSSSRRRDYSYDDSSRTRSSSRRELPRVYQSSTDGRWRRGFDGRELDIYGDYNGVSSSSRDRDRTNYSSYRSSGDDSGYGTSSRRRRDDDNDDYYGIDLSSYSGGAYGRSSSSRRSKSRRSSRRDRDEDYYVDLSSYDGSRSGWRTRW